jgi:hypothetical protein
LSGEPGSATWLQFDAGPVIVICPTALPDVQGPLTDEQNHLQDPRARLYDWSLKQDGAE